MRKILIAGAVVFGLGSHGAWAAGDAAAGATKAAACFACHGQDGNSAAPTFPKLAEQSTRYLSKQIHDIKSGVRPVPAMAGQTDNLSDQDIDDIAAYFSSKKASVNQAKKDLVAKGEQIFRGGIREKGVPACAACHAPNGIGNAPAGFPRLGGQHADYVAAQLKAYRAAADGDASGRVTDGDTKPMRGVAARLSDSEIAALASYISGLH
ncbi:MAG TPA: c-type cytochrome [Spongiibacteraceae bacterium]|nr:c-type cytochrome [Spongiibacteraceae bacterium]